MKLRETPEAPGLPAAWCCLHGPHLLLPGVTSVSIKLLNSALYLTICFDKMHLQFHRAPGKLKFPELSVIHKRSEKAIDFADD